MAANEDNIIDLTASSTATNDKQYQNALSDYHKYAEKGGGSSAPGSNVDMYDAYSSSGPTTSSVVIRGRPLIGTLESMVPLLSALTLPFHFFVTTTLHGVEVDSASEKAANLDAEYVIEPFMSAVYGRHLDLTELESSNSKNQRFQILHRRTLGTKNTGLMGHALLHFNPIQLTKSSRFVTVNGQRYIDYTFDPQVMDLNDITAKTMLDYHGGTLAEDEPGLVYRVPELLANDKHLEPRERMVSFQFQFATPQDAMRFLHNVGHHINWNTVSTNMVGNLHLNGFITYDSAHRILARNWMDFAGNESVNSATAFATMNMALGYPTYTSTAAIASRKTVGYTVSSTKKPAGAIMFEHALSNTDAAMNATLAAMTWATS